MSPRFLRRAAVMSWALFAACVAVLFLSPDRPPEPLPSWFGPVLLFTGLLAQSTAIWSLVGLACAVALKAGRVPRTARTGVVLSWASAAMQVPLVVDYVPAAQFWQDVLRMGLPVMLLALACANASLLSMARVGPRSQWLVTSSAAAMFALAVLVTAMVIVDSGNRALFGVLGVLLLVAIIPALLVGFGHWMGRRRGNQTVTAPGPA